MSENVQSTNSKKKKKRHRKRTRDELATLQKDGSKERKPLHNMMETLQVCKEVSPAPAIKGDICDTIMNRKAAGSNWKAQLDIGKKVEEIADENQSIVENIENTASELSKSARMRQKRKAAQLNKYVAMDCEMVGVGFNGQADLLARVSIVNKRGDVLLDKFVKPQEAVVDYRTSVSGIRPHDIENGEEFKVVQEEVIQLLQGKTLIGHGIRNDLAVLHIKHPFANIRDTSRYKPLCRLVSNGNGRTPSLKKLSQVILGLEIQTGEHNSVEDARAAMSIYNRLSRDWETYLKKHQHRKL